MANINAVFPSKWLKAAELNGRSYRMTITSFVVEDIGDGEHKPVVYFKGAQKGLMLNKTNAFEIAAAYGEETDAWIGREIEVFPSTTMYQGRSTPCIRVRPVLTAAVGVPGDARKPAPEIPGPLSADDYGGSDVPF